MMQRRASKDLEVGNISPVETAEYIADMTTELSRMAQGSRLDLLSSILQIARLEALTSVRRLTESREGGKLPAND